jgi:hypothetical protein
MKLSTRVQIWWRLSAVRKPLVVLRMVGLKEESPASEAAERFIKNRLQRKREESLKR